MLEQSAMLGPYQIVSLLGEGGMGAVYRAKDTRLGRDVAIKVLTNVTLSDKERLVRFEQEARATGMLNHPNLLTIFDVGRDADDNPYLVSELLEGETLTSRLARGALSPRKAVDAALQMAHGLAAAHEKGIVHRDLKPDNIFLTRDGRLKILDFGIAKLTSGLLSESNSFQMAATEPGMVLGTVGYMSPEQVRGESVDQRSDIFSLGAIFYEMLTGARAFKRSSAIETLSAILKEDPPELTELLPSIPPALERLVRRCLEKDREVRFQSARDLAFNLETLSTMSSAATLSNVARPVTSAAPPGGMTGPTPTMRQNAPTAITATPPGATGASVSAAAVHETRAHRPPTIARTAYKPKPRVSPVLLGLLYLVSIAGASYGGWYLAQRMKGTPIEPQFHRMTFRRGEVRSARFTPDGETIVYSAAWDGRPSEIFVVSRGATEARPLGIEDSEVLGVSRSAELAILLHRDRVTNVGTLARVPLAGGVPREVADGVLQADWSPDGANLAIIRQVDGKSRIEYPIGTVRYETPHVVRDVRISPDGKRLAILEPIKGEWTVGIIEQGAPVTLAHGWARGATGLAWSADGNDIWVSGTSNSAPPALYAVTSDGAQRLVTRLPGSIRMFDVSRRGDALLSSGTWRAGLVWKPAGTVTVAATPPVTTTGAATPPPPPVISEMPERDASWLDWSILADLSPDGKTLLFSETREGGGTNSAVYLRQLDAATPVHLGDGIADALSPDGKWVLCHHGSKLAVLPTGTGEARELNIKGSFDNGAIWLPDSRRVVVGGYTGDDPYRIYILDTLDETLKAISPSDVWSGGTRAFAVTPDARFVAGMTKDEMIALYPTGGGAPVPLPGTEKGEIPLQFSADSASLLVYRPTGLPARVYRITLGTGARELWKEFTPPDPAGVYKIAPVVVTSDMGAYAYNALRVLSELYIADGLK